MYSLAVYHHSFHYLTHCVSYLLSSWVFSYINFAPINRRSSSPVQWHKLEPQNDSHHKSSFPWYGNERHSTFPTCPRLSLVRIVVFNTWLKGIRVPNPYLLLAIVVHQLILSMCSTSSLWSATDMPRWLNLQSNQPLFSDTTWVESDIDRHDHLRWQ